MSTQLQSQITEKPKSPASVYIDFFLQFETDIRYELKVNVNNNNKLYVYSLKDIER